MKRTISITSFIQDQVSGGIEINYRVDPGGGTGVLVYSSQQEFLDACVDPINNVYDIGAKIALASYLGVDPLVQQTELLTGVATEVDFADMTIVRRVIV